MDSGKLYCTISWVRNKREEVADEHRIVANYSPLLGLMEPDCRIFRIPSPP